MRLGIDASNIRRDGVLTHLVEILKAARPLQYGFKEVIVWGGEATLSRLEDRSWLRKCHARLLDGALPFRTYWQLFLRDRTVCRARCDVLFMPQSLHVGVTRPFVAMSQNLLPFEWNEAKRYGISWQLLRLALLRRMQSKCFKGADGVIFLTEYARNRVLSVIGGMKGANTIIPHGINRKFIRSPRDQVNIAEYSERRPFRMLYVSTIDMYKHQWHVVEAVMSLRRLGFPLCLDLVGPAYSPALRRLRTSSPEDTLESRGIRYRGPIPYAELPEIYQGADLFVYASSCENLPNILLEAMAAGLPVACSNRGPMPEVLSDGGVYFDPENPTEIAEAIRTLVDSPALRAEKALAGFLRAQMYSWDRCASETFAFFASLSR